MASAGCRAALVGALAAVLLIGLPGVARGHGDEDLTEQPARALVQQALGLLTQAGEPLEAHERLEAALESKDRKGVQIPAVRAAMRALDRGEHEEAVAHMNEALAPEEEPPAEQPGEDRDAEDEAAGAEAEEGEGHEEDAAMEPTEEALSDHADAIDPDRGASEWIGLAFGIVLIGGGGAALLTRRRGPA